MFQRVAVDEEEHSGEIMSKGDRPRPVNKKKYDENYDRIFRKAVRKDEAKVRTN